MINFIYLKQEQQKLIARLEEKERMRIRKLRLQGLIHDDEDDDKYFSSKKYPYLQSSNDPRSSKF